MPNRATALLTSLLLLAFTAAAKDVTFAWDASPTTGITNYVIYASTNNFGAGTTLKQNAGTSLTTTLTNVTPGVKWWFYVTAGMDGFESVPSNVVTFTVPHGPALLRVIFGP